MVRGEGGDLDRARAVLLARVGPEGLVDAAAVISNFERMDRIADATGIPLDRPLEIFSGEIRASLELGRFGSAANTPVSGRALHALGRALRPVRRPLTRLFLAARRMLAGGRA